MIRMSLFALPVAAFAFAGIMSGTAMAQEDLVAKRKDAMKAAGKSMFGTLGQMSRERKPYAQAEVDAALAQLETFGKTIAPLYPESTKGVPSMDEYSASDKVWENKADFDAHIVDLDKVVAANKDTIKDLDSLKAAFPALSKTCSGCHETYRLKNG